MKKINSSIKFFAIISLTCILNTSCWNNYLNPQEIDINEYSAVLKELSARASIVDSLFLGPNPKMAIGAITLGAFQYNKGLIKIFPKSYNLLNEKKAIEIQYFSERCIFIILRIHEGTFKDRWECLKISDSKDCESSLRSERTVEKEWPLKDGWRYQIVVQYIDT